MTVQAELLAQKERAGELKQPSNGGELVQMASGSVTLGHRTTSDMAEAAMMRGATDVAARLWEERNKEKAALQKQDFETALSQAQAEFRPVIKNRQVGYETTKGGTVGYRHEDLAQIADVINPILSKYGLSYRWRSSNDYKAGLITVTCILCGHGHSEENSLTAGVDAGSGKNHLQAIASAQTYLQRHTLKPLVGVTVSNEPADDDGRAAGFSNCVSDDQAKAITQLAVNVKANPVNFLQFMAAECKRNISTIADIPADKYDFAISMLNAKAASDRKVAAAKEAAS